MFRQALLRLAPYWRPYLSLWAAAALALLLWLLFGAARRRYNALPGLAIPEDRQAVPDCMVVIPARDEAAVIGRAVRSLPPDTVIVVDDQSQDQTAEAAREAGAGVVPAPPPPRRTIGKANACAAGAKVLTSRWVLFTDADTWFEPGFLPAAVATAEAGGLTLLSLHLQPEYETFAERAVVPYARALFFCGAGPKNSPKPLFSGQCMLVLRDAYVFIGGHGAAAGQLFEEVKLMGLAERHRLKVAVARATGLGHARLYAGWQGIREGIERHAYRFALLNPLRGGSILVAAVLMALWIPELVWLLRGKHWVVAAVLAGLPFLLLRPWYESWSRAWAAPLAIYGLLPTLLRAALSAVMGKRLVWKGRTI